MKTLPKNILFFFLINAAALLAQSQGEESKLSPLMMERPGAENHGWEKMDDRLQAITDPRNGTVVDDPSSAVLRGTFFSGKERGGREILPLPPSQEERMLMQGELNHRMIDSAKARVMLDVAHEKAEELDREVLAGVSESNKMYDENEGAPLPSATVEEQIKNDIRAKILEQKVKDKNYFARAAERFASGSYYRREYIEACNKNASKEQIWYFETMAFLLRREGALILQQAKCDINWKHASLSQASENTLYLWQGAFDDLSVALLLWEQAKQACREQDKKECDGLQQEALVFINRANSTITEMNK